MISYSLPSPSQGDRQLTSIGQVHLPVTFGQRDNYRTELIDFDIAHIRLSYNAILGYRELAKFKAVTHHGINIQKMPGSGGIITAPCEERDAVCSHEHAFRAAAIEDADSEGTQYPPKAIPIKKKQLLRTGPQGGSFSSGTASGSAPAPGTPPSLELEGTPGALLGQGSGAFFWRATDLTNIMREELGHHVEACFAALFPQEGTGRGVPGTQECIVKATQELQEARDMRGDCRPPDAIPHPGEDGRLCICIDIPGLNKAASQERF